MSTDALSLALQPAAESCQATLARHGKSFAFASVWLSPDVRADAAALYAWCRRADDLVDLPRVDPRAALGELRRELERVYRGESQAHPALAAFQKTVLERQIPVEYPSALLDGLAMDAEGCRYDTSAELFVYCHRVAGTVGLMMAHTLGVSDIRALANAAGLGIAMQLTNISRDVLEDWQRERLYVPHELLGGELGVQPGDELTADARRALAQGSQRLLDEAERWYAAGERGLRALPWRASLAIACASRVYRRIGAHVRRRGCDPLGPRATVPLAEKLVLAGAALLRMTASLPARALRPHRRVAIDRVVRFPDDVIHIV